MKFKFNIYNLITSCLFLVAFLSLMLSYLARFMFFVASASFCAGFVMLSIKLVKNYVSQKQTREEIQEAIVMELAEGENGDQYVMQNNNKQKRKKFWGKIDALLPSIFCILASCLFAYAFISGIVKLF